MAIMDNEAQEGLNTVKHFFEDHRKTIAAAIIVILIGVLVAWWWQWHNATRYRDANRLYVDIVRLSSSGETQQVKALVGELAEKYPSTAFASLGLMVAARINYEQKDYKNAKAELTQVVDKAVSPELRDIARLRLASVLSDEKSYDEALKVLSAKPVDEMADSFAELRGDIFAAQGEREKGRAAYKEAMEKAFNKDDPLRADQRRAIEMKIDGIGSSTAS